MVYFETDVKLNTGVEELMAYSFEATVVSKKLAAQAAADAKAGNVDSFWKILSVSIVGRVEVAGVTTYQVRLFVKGKIVDQSVGNDRRYNDFVELFENLKKEGFSDLPKLPRKLIFATENDLQKR